MFAEIRLLGYSFLPMDAAEKASLKSFPPPLPSCLNQSPKEPEQLQKLFIRSELCNNWGESEKPFWALGNAHTVVMRGPNIKHSRGMGLSHKSQWRWQISPWMQDHTRWMEELWNQRGLYQEKMLKLPT